MSQGKEELIKYRLERSRETLDEAKLMLEADHLYGATNRIYYACFYAVSAMMMKHDLFSKKHSGVLALFNQHFVKTGRVPLEFGKFYSRMFNLRNETDYADHFGTDKQIISEALDQAKAFVDKISSLMNVL